MNYLENTCSLSVFQQNIKTFLDRLKKTGQPQMVTIDGKTKIVLQDAESYQKILDRLDRLEALEGIQRGLESMKQGNGHPAEEVLQRLANKLGIPATS